jgi:hypothetical protein
MNSACGGLRPMVGLRRPGGCLLRRRRPTPGAQAPWKADFNRRGGLRPAVGLRRPGGCLLRRRRPTPGAERLWKADFNRRGGLRPMVGLCRPRRGSFASAEADAWRGGCRMRPVGAFADGRPVHRIAASAEAFGRACLGSRIQSAWGPSADGRPAPTGRGSFCVGGRPTPGAQAPAEFNSAWRPSAGGRPAPTEGAAFASAEADAWRGALIRARADRRFRYSGPDSQMVSVSCNGGFGQVMIEAIIPRGIDDHRWGHGSS